ncbi:MAG: primosomal protein N' [Robiginitomaculum sp.]
MTRIISVLFPVGVPEPFDYLLPDDVPFAQSAGLGSFVYAPLGNQMKLGVIWSIKDNAAQSHAQKPKRPLKSVGEVKNCAPLSVSMLKFVDFTAKYNCCPQGLVLRMVIRSYKALGPSPIVTKYAPSNTLPTKMTPARQQVIDAMASGELADILPARAAEIAKAAGVSPAVVSGLAKVGGLRAIKEPLDAPFDVPNPDHVSPRAVTMTDGQIAASAELRALVAQREFNVALLDGVTGSGKTEVYFESVAEALRQTIDGQGGQVLVLVPEIALTQAGLSRFADRFNAVPAQWHSAMGEAARRRTWREVATGRARLVVGARSALYLPFKNLRVIIVDEEHDTSYKQEEGVIYNARDMAVVRGKIEGASIVLASATPALESLVNARTGRYHHIILPERPGAAIMPEVGLVDLKEDKPERGKYLSAPLIEGARESLGRGEQVMFYLNRRGYAPLIICRNCGEKLKSPDTDSWLVEHRRTGRAMCHRTGFSMRMPTICPNCKSDDSLQTVGPGVERIEEEARGLFPDARIEVFSSDTSGSPEQIRARIARMAGGEIDILIGTQMVVKGHNFPRLTFVGVVDGDLGLAGGDLRAGERTYQTLVQVAGRAGRADRPGRALIQTHMPEHEALAALAAGDREGFIRAELDMREILGLPPYGKLAAVIISGPDPRAADDAARAFTLKAPRADGIEILGPAEAPMAMLRGRHRRRLLITAEPSVNLPAYMAAWRAKYRPKSKIKIQIDIDPQSFV